jgi:hypothetical protein
MATLKKKTRTLKVTCNPFAVVQLVEDGDEGELRCLGAFPHEPDRVFGDEQVRHVGAKRVVALVSEGDDRSRMPSVHIRAFEFTHEVQTVNRSEYYRRALLSRELLAADEDTHAYAFGSKKGFVHPHAYIAQKSIEHGDLLPAHFGELEPPPAPPVISGEEGEEPEVPVEIGAGDLPEPPVSPEPKWAAVLAPHKEKHLQARAKAEQEAEQLRAKEAAARVAKAAHEVAPHA